MKPNPTNDIKVFVEDKLVTDKGFRIKYSLTVNDAHFRPAIDVLIRKYFIREEGNSIELSHDVLVPLILTDRNKRMAADARAKANRKAWDIAAIGMLLILLASGLVYGRIISDARKLKGILENKNDSLKKAIVRDSVRAQYWEDSVSKQKNLGKAKELMQNNPQIKDLMALLTKDSTKIANWLDSINKANEESMRLKKRSFELQKAINQIRERDSLYRIKIADRVRASTLRLMSRQRDTVMYQPRHMMLPHAKEIYIRDTIYIIKKQIIRDTVKVQECLNNTLTGHLYNSFSKDKGAISHIRIYFIPFKSQNRKIIRESSYFEIATNEEKLKNAQQSASVITDNEGNFSIKDLPPGKYLAKICTFYGGYYIFKKKANTNEIVEWNSSPPY